MRLPCWIYTLLSILLPCLGAAAQGGDSIRLPIQKADSIFLKENLVLLSQSYNISVKEALVIQAKAYPNPVISATFNAIDPQNEKYFHVGATGQKEFGIEQLLILGGKRKSGISIAKQSEEIARMEFAELLRNLRLQLHSSFYQLNKHRIVLSSYDRQLGVLELLIQSYEEQSTKGNIPIKDVIRLKTIHLRITNSRIEARSAFQEDVKKIQILLHLTAIPIPVINEQVFQSFQQQYDFSSLLDSAYQHRPDLEIANREQSLASSQLKLQKQMTVPDMIVNSGYDQQGGAFRNQIQLGLVIPVPLWNRNKGNIRAAGFEELNAGLFIQQKRNEIYADVLSAWGQMKTSIEEYAKASQLYTREFTDVFDGINENFRRRNISILEFVDFFEAYNESLADFQRIKTQLALSAEQLNYSTASSIY